MSHKWRILYHPEAEKDLSRIGKSRAKRAIRAIDEKLGVEPEKFGAPLRKGLAGLRKLRVGDIRIVYQTEKEQIKEPIAKLWVDERQSHFEPIFGIE